MRRGSLVGPLLLIGIGIWFLMSTLRPDLPLLDMAARFWPFLLIAWGLLRLIEIFVWAARGNTVPGPGISGGEWTLVVFVCLIGSGLYMANHYRPWGNFGVIHANRVEIFGHSYDYTIPESKTAAGKATRVLIENMRGNARVTGGDVTDVTASGRKTIRSLQEKDANAADKQCPVEVTAQAEQIVVRTNQDRVTGEQRVSTDLEVTVPRGMTVEVRGREGEIEVAELNGGVTVSSDNAQVRLQNIGGNVRLDLRKSDLIRGNGLKGSIEVDSGRGRDVDLDTVAGEVVLTGSYSGDLQLRNLAKALRIQAPNTDLRVARVPGQLHMDLGQLSGNNLVGPIRLASSRARDVQLDQFTDSLELVLDQGDISLRPTHVPLAKIDARTRNGRVEIALPPNAKFDLKAVTDRGEISNEFGSALKTTSEDGDGEHRRGGSIVGSLGPGPSIVVQTDRGSLTVRKDSGTPLVAHNQDQDEDRDKHQHPEIEKQ
ncbi:MAG TPA: DUF4097 family beta strand repeat-containing protein [Bryobacteraceae bacterium]